MRLRPTYGPRIVRMYLDGVTVPEIAEAFGIAERTVYRWVAKANLPPEQWRCPQSHHREAA